MKIKEGALELISKRMGDLKSGNELIDFLSNCGVPNNLVEYPQTKWRMLYSIFTTLSKSESTDDHRLLLKVISEFAHPLNLGGDETEAKKTIKDFNDWLRYDRVKLILDDNGVRYTHPADKAAVENAIKSSQKTYKKNINDLKNNLDSLIFIKKSYQALINIIEIFSENNFEPDEKLNEYYVKIKDKTRLTSFKLYELVQDTTSSNMKILSNPYFPFKNLYGAQKEFDEPLKVSKSKIKADMNHTFGEILGLCMECEAGDIMKEAESQDLLNEVSSYLTDMKKDLNEVNTIRNGKLVYNIGNREIMFDKNTAVELDPESEVGKFLIELMNNVGKLISYAKLSYSIGLIKNLKDFDAGAKSALLDIRNKLSSKLQEAGIDKEAITKEWIQSRRSNGYIMPKR